jgi:serine phosphatase RsbU (regulator of sigma subunit)
MMDALRTHVISALKQTGASGESKDGMDMVLCSFDPANSELKFAGANNGLLIREAAGLTEIKPDKQPVGLFGTHKPFTTHTIKLCKGAVVYCYSDGLADQFGGPKGKKFKFSNFKVLLEEVKHLNMKDQEQTILARVDAWKLNYEQTDDITLFAVKII